VVVGERPLVQDLAENKRHVEIMPGASPTTLSYNVSVVKIYSATTY
jgi:hypothetical protein